MTVSSQICSATRSWTGVETQFATGFKAEDATHCTVKTATATLTRGVHYSSYLSPGSGELIVTPLGAMPTAPQTLTIDRATPALQTDNLENGNAYDADAKERLFDRTIMGVQEAKRDANLARSAAEQAAADVEAALSGISAGPVQSVNGAGGVVVLSKTDVGLGNADNTSDANKPISTAQAAALAGKQPLLGFTPVDVATKGLAGGYAGLKAPAINTGYAGANTYPGIATGHIRFGNPADEIDAFVGLRGDLYWANAGQEMRGATITTYNARTTGNPDEATYGFDNIALDAVSVASAYNQMYLRGSHKGVVGQYVAQAPISGSYLVETAYPFQATTILGPNTDIAKLYGMVIGTPIREESGYDAAVPVPETRIQIGYGVLIQEQLGRSAKAAIKFGGRGDGGRLVWGSTHLTEDTSGKMEINLGGNWLSLVNPRFAGTFLTTGTIPIPANCHAILNVLGDGSGFGIPLIRI